MFRTRMVKSEANDGHGQLRTIEHVKAIGNDTYQGKLPGSSKIYRIRGRDIRKKSKTYRLRKSHDHRECYELIVTQREVYHKIQSMGHAVGPMQRDSPKAPKKRFNLCNGKSYTEKDLQNVKGFKAWDVILIEGREYLRETYGIMRGK